MYFALERLVHRIAKTLGLDPLDVIRRNLVPGEAFPYRAASGSRLDSGDYRAALDTATAGGRLDRLRARRDAARAAGRRYGIGFAAVVEPSISNMGYITMALTAGERARVGPKDGAAASATVSIDPIGSIAAHVASVPQGQGHRTVLAQVIADVLGVEFDDVTVNVEHDTQKDPWSIAAGNYSSRTRALVDAVSTLSSRRTVVGTRLKRDLDEAWEAERCSLEPRCPHGEAACREPQTLRDLTRGHQAACWKA